MINHAFSGARRSPFACSFAGILMLSVVSGGCEDSPPGTDPSAAGGREITSGSLSENGMSAMRIDDEAAARVGLDRGGAVRKEPVNAAAHLLTQGLEAASVAEDVVSVPAMRRVAAGRAAAAAAGAQRAEGDARRRPDCSCSLR